MFKDYAILALSVVYVAALFAFAWIGDLSMRARSRPTGRPLIYALSLGVYCSTWTFFGSVGLAATTGYGFIPVYLGPILMFMVGWPLILRIVRLAKGQNITSISDFLAARYGKSPMVAAIVTCLAVVGLLPYIALQLKAVGKATEMLVASTPGLAAQMVPVGLTELESGLVIAGSLALFAVLFGTRHIDATEHQDGLMLAISAESVVKLAAFLAIGIYAVFYAFGSPTAFFQAARESPRVVEMLTQPLHGGTWLTISFLSLVCIILLPRQFHVTVVENRSEDEIRRAAWLFPLYLVLINIFVIPIAAAGLVLLPEAGLDLDLMVLALPLTQGADGIATLAFIGGLSAAIAMVVVESIALAIMICNGVIVPALLRQHVVDAAAGQDIGASLLNVRRVTIVVVVLLAYVVQRALGDAAGLAAIGLISFAAIAQLAPAFFIGLYWRNATARGAIAGIAAGLAVWAYTLLLPWVIKAGWMSASLMEEGPLGIALLKPQALFFLSFEPLTHGVVWSMAANIGALVVVSLWRSPEPIERLQAQLFVRDDSRVASNQPALRPWRTSITVGDLQATAGRYLGSERALRAFAEYGAGRGTPLAPSAEADMATLRFTEHLLTSAIGAASSRLVLSLLLRRSNIGSQAALKLLDDASEALQYNRDLLQLAIDQVRHGLGVFDGDHRLICWNRQFRSLLDLPAEYGAVGVRLDKILRLMAERGDLGRGNVDELVAERLMRLTVTRETAQERLQGGRRIIEIRTAPMPQGGIVATFSDITDRVMASNALAQVNLTLERRVEERTAELLELNTALAVAKARADEANQDKTRFIAAAGHDILQPLNAARLYATSLVERSLPPVEAAIASNIDASLTAVEEIFGTLIEIARIDAGRLEAQLAPTSLKEVFEGLRVEFEPLAAEKGLELKVIDTSLWARTDRKLIRRVLQNLVGNAIKYTEHGAVLMGARRRHNTIEVIVADTGPGIPKSQQSLIFKEFQRLDGRTGTARGLGLGLSIVDRLCRVLDAPLKLDSDVGRGSRFSVMLPRSAPVARAEQAPAPAAQAQLSGALVMCIDNEPAVLEGMRTLLGGWGCEVLVASDLESARVALSERGELPDVVFADYHLDEGTGDGVIQALRAMLKAEVPGVIITADHTPEVERVVRDQGFILLRKPVKAGALRAILGQLRRQRIAAE